MRRLNKLYFSLLKPTLNKDFSIIKSPIVNHVLIFQSPEKTLDFEYVQVKNFIKALSLFNGKNTISKIASSIDTNKDIFIYYCIYLLKNNVLITDSHDFLSDQIKIFSSEKKNKYIKTTSLGLIGFDKLTKKIYEDFLKNKLINKTLFYIDKKDLNQVEVFLKNKNDKTTRIIQFDKFIGSNLPELVIGTFPKKYKENNYILNTKSLKKEITWMPYFFNHLKNKITIARFYGNKPDSGCFSCLERRLNENNLFSKKDYLYFAKSKPVRINIDELSYFFCHDFKGSVISYNYLTKTVTSEKILLKKYDCIFCNQPTKTKKISLRNKKAIYFENGLRIKSAEEVEKKLIPLVSDWGIISRRLSFSSNHVVLSADPIGFPEQRVHYGKGISARQGSISSLCEAIERYYSKTKSKAVFASFNSLGSKAVDPKFFILPKNSSYTDAKKISWAKGYDLTLKKEVLVPEDLVFLKPVSEIVNFTTNGLSTGNCLEEAVLQGLFEVVERDFHFIMEANNLCLPDVDISNIHSKQVDVVLEFLKKNKIKYFVKYLTNDINIPGFGVFLKGKRQGKNTYSFAPGVHLNKEIALTRALTEAIQLYPHIQGQSTWLKSKNINLYMDKGPKKISFNKINSFTNKDLLVNINQCVSILNKIGSRVIIVDLTKENNGFQVVRVLVTGLQPPVNKDLQNCFSSRLFEVPKKLGFINKIKKESELYLGPVCGWSGL